MNDDETVPDADLAQLRCLPEVPLELSRAARLLRRPMATFIEAAPRGRSTLSAQMARAYFRAEPLLAGAVCAVYLVWALKTAFGLLR